MFAQFSRFSTMLVLALAISAPVFGQEIDQLFKDYNAQMAAGSYAEAVRTANRMVEIAPTQNWQASSYNAVGRALNSQLRFDEAGPFLEKALAIPLAEGNSNRGWIPNNLGHNLRKRKKFAEAEKMLSQAQAEFEKQFGPKSEQVATVRSNLGWLFYDQDQFDKAAAIHQEVLALNRSLFGDEGNAVGSSLSDLGTAQIGQGQFAESEKNLRRALEIKRNALGSDAPDVAIVLGNLADLFRKQKEFAKAEDYARQSVAIRQKLFGRKSAVVAADLAELAGDLKEQGKADEAKALLDEVAAIEKTLTDSPPEGNNPFRVGQRIQIKVERANVMGGANVLATVSKGMQFDVTHVQGKWCGVKVTLESGVRSGWIDADDLTLALVGAARREPLILKHEVASADGKFRILMPRQPGFSQQKEFGIEHNGYSLESPQGKFLAAWFDVPAGSSFSFDTALDAFVSARGGQLASEDKISLEDEYPGREWLVSLPDGDFCRMQLIAVKDRYYQLIIEGDEELVTSKEADAYFSSFKRTSP